MNPSQESEKRPWCKPHQLTWILLIPVFLFWILMAAPGRYNVSGNKSVSFLYGFQTAASQRPAVSNTEFFANAILARNDIPSGVRRSINLARLDAQTTADEFEVHSHGWPYVAIDRVKVHLKGVDKTSKVKWAMPEEGKRKWEPAGLEATPYWAQASGWSPCADWYYWRWQGLVGNLFWALLSIGTAGLLIEAWIRRFGARIRLWKFVALISLAAGGCAIVGNWVNSVKTEKQLMQKDERITFVGLKDDTPEWMTRLFGQSAAGLFTTHQGIDIYWDENMPDDFWKAGLDRSHLEFFRVHNRLGMFELECPQVPLSERFFKRLGRSSNLTQISFSYCEFESSDLKQLNGLSILEQLTINHCQLDDSAIEAFEKITTLEQLSLRNTGLSKQAIGRLRKSRPNLQINFEP